MEKAFVWDPVMRSSAIKYDPCIVKKGVIQCDDCKITLIADRFLGKEFHRNILGKMGKSRSRYPYVIIAVDWDAICDVGFAMPTNSLTKTSH